MHVVGVPVKLEIAGREFVKFASIFRVNDSEIHITHYATRTNGFILTFQMLSADPNELQKLELAMQSLHFADSVK